MNQSNLMPEVKTIPTKHIFIDVVEFTSERSVEAQSEIVYILNDIVLNSTKKLNINDERVIFLPTGDGMDIVLLNIEDPYDGHILLALEILQSISNHNATLQEDIKKMPEGDVKINEKIMRQFEIRIGINSNVDNLITDINGTDNIAGAGINMAQRIMSQGDGGQILVGQSVYDTLRFREKYMNAFERYYATIKHDFELELYQLIQKGHNGLNIDEPSKLKDTNENTELKLTLTVAYYFAYLIKHKEIIIKQESYQRNASVILFWYWANDSVGFDFQTVNTKYIPRTPKKELSLEEQLKYINSIDYYIVSDLSRYIKNKELRPYDFCFEGGYYHAAFLNQIGEEKLRTEHGDILDKVMYSNTTFFEKLANVLSK